MSREKIDKTYIGDGIYADDIGYAMILTTEDGISVQNVIHIEVRELKAINRYAEAIWGKDWDQ